VTAEQAHDLLARAIAPPGRYPLHVLLIEHGRKVCKPANPRCGQCVLLKDCAAGLVRIEDARLEVPEPRRISLSAARRGR